MSFLEKISCMATVMFLLIFFSEVHLAAQEKGGNPSQADREMNRNSTKSLIANFESSGRVKWQKPDKVIAMLGDLSDKTVMDIGAGSGYFTFRLAKVSGKVIAADVNDRFLKYLNARRDSLVKVTGKDNIEVRKIPYNSPGLEPHEVNAVLIVDTYHHIENRVDYLKKLRRGIKPGGVLMIVDFKLGNGIGPPDRHKLRPDVVLDEMREAGFKDILLDNETLPYQYILLTGSK